MRENNGARLSRQRWLKRRAKAGEERCVCVCKRVTWFCVCHMIVRVSHDRVPTFAQSNSNTYQLCNDRLIFYSVIFCTIIFGTWPVNKIIRFGLSAFQSVKTTLSVRRVVTWSHGCGQLYYGSLERCTFDDNNSVDNAIKVSARLKFIADIGFFSLLFLLRMICTEREFHTKSAKNCTLASLVSVKIGPDNSFG